MLRLRHVPLVLRAIARWVVTTKAGRRLGLGVAGIAVLSATCAEPSSRKGTWTGFHNNYAPNKGAFVLEPTWTGATTCVVQGRTGYTSGSGWVFKGDATIQQTSCEGRVGWGGKVSAALELRMDWDGRVKGIGGDWDDVSGRADCKGSLEGTLRDGGAWQGTCRRQDDGREWAASFEWKPDGG